MKKMFLFLILILGGLISNGQLRPPIQPRSENGYSIESAERFALSDKPIADSWRENLLTIINGGLKKAGINKTYNLSYIKVIMSKITYELVELDRGYVNSRQSADGKSVEFYQDKESYSGQCAVFYEDGVRIVLYKTSCLNLLKIPVEIEQIEPEQEDLPKPEPRLREEKKEKPAMEFFEPDPCSILSFTANPNSFRKRKGTVTLLWETKNTSFVNITGVGNNLFSSGTEDMDVFMGKRGDSIAFVLSAFQNGQFCKSATVYVFRKPMQNRLIFKRVPDWVEGPIYVFILEEITRRWVVPAIFSKNVTPVVIEPRTMPPGLDSNTSNGGLDSDPRNMGGGLSGFAQRNYTPKTFGFGVNFSF